MKLCFQGVCGSVKKSKFYNVLVALMAILPLVDICTDYAFLIITFTKENASKLERVVPKISEIVTDKFRYN